MEKHSDHRSFTEFKARTFDNAIEKHEENDYAQDS